MTSPIRPGSPPVSATPPAAAASASEALCAELKGFVEGYLRENLYFAKRLQAANPDASNAPLWAQAVGPKKADPKNLWVLVGVDTAFSEDADYWPPALKETWTEIEGALRAHFDRTPSLKGYTFTLDH